MHLVDAALVVIHRDLILPDQYYIETHVRHNRDQMPQLTQCRSWMTDSRLHHANRNSLVIDGLLSLFQGQLPSVGDMIMDCPPVTIGTSHV